MNRSILYLVATLVLAAAFAWLSPAAAVQPGRVQAAHSKLADDCRACHTAFSGVSDAKCSACHTPEEIGQLQSDHTPVREPKPALQKLHGSALAAGATCTQCHAEHAGRLEAGRATRFAHERLPDSLRSDCVACHREQRPDDEMHASSADGCAACHGTTAWKPSTLDHGRFFRFDSDHPARCTDCHAPGRPMREYTCYGCHEHTPANVESEHREEGIRDLANCVECHRGADEHGGSEREGHGREGDDE